MPTTATPLNCGVLAHPVLYFQGAYFFTATVYNVLDPARYGDVSELVLPCFITGFEIPVRREDLAVLFLRFEVSGKYTGSLGYQFTLDTGRNFIACFINDYDLS